MKIKTKVEVTYNVGINGKETGLVVGVLGSVAYESDFTKIGANYGYFKEDGSLITQSAFFIDGEAEINGLFEAIQPTLPEFVDEVSNTRNKFYAGFIYHMAQTFGISTTDIEITE